jgi:flagellar biosynthesis/type III secretory pathway M-ring protein FliF/YscJ
MNTEEKDNHGQRISKLEGAVQGISTQIENLIKHQDARDQHQAERDKVLFKKLDEAREMSRPNMATWAAWAAVIVVVIFGIYTPFAAGLNEKVAASSKQGELADKIQQMQIETVEKQVEHLTAWQDDRNRADLEELRARRLRDAGIK